MNHLLRTLSTALVLVVVGMAPITSQAVGPDTEATAVVINLAYSAVRFRVKLFGLARISHQLSTATAQGGALTGVHSVGLLDVVSTTPARPSVANASQRTTLSSLATRPGEKSRLARIVGQFERLNGQMMSSGGEGNCSVQMRIDVSSVNTNDASLDAYLRSPGFFHTEKYPQIMFSSSRLVLGDNGLQQIVGDLSLHGTTRPVVFHIEVSNSTSDTDRDANRIQAKAIIKRSEFGLNSLRHIVSDEVEIIVAMQAG